MTYSKAQLINALTTIIKIQERIIKANAAAARAYKKELKLTTKLYKKAFNHWLEEMDASAGLRKDGQYIWDERRMLESGRLKPIAHLIKIPEDNPAWETKFREQSYSFKDLIKKRKKGKK